jgi:hypothetical protein
MEGQSHQLDNLILVTWILLIPVGVLLAITLYNLATLLYDVKNFLNVVRYEMSPVMKELRLTAEHLESISAKAASSVDSLEKGVNSVKPLMGKGADKLKDLSHNVQDGVASLFGGLKRSLQTR